MIRTIVILTLLIATAKAAPPPGPVDPEMRDWYRSLKQPNTGSGCCSIADCRTYVSRISGDHYEVYIKNRWFTVPNELVLHRENKADLATPLEID